MPVRRLALAIVDTAKATAEVRKRIERVAAGAAEQPELVAPAGRAAIPAGHAAVHPASHPGGRRRGARHRRRRDGVAVALVLGGDRRVRDLRRHQLLGRNPRQGLAAVARHGARCAQRRAGRHAGVRQHHRLAGDDLRMFVLRFLFHEGHLQPDDLLDQHHAGVDVRPARRIHLWSAAVADRGDRGGRGHRDRGRRAGIADQHPSEDSRRRPHVFPDAVRSRRGVGHQSAGYPRTGKLDRDGTSTRPRPGAVPDHRQADERRGRRISGAPNHAARLADAHRERSLRANPGPQQRDTHRHVPRTRRRDQIDRQPDPAQHRRADHVAGVQPGRDGLSVHRLHRRRGDSRPPACRSAACTGSPTVDERIACAAPDRPRRHQRRRLGATWRATQRPCC